MKHISYKGVAIDMDMLKFKYQHSVALGNAHMNARGDIIGNGGTVIKSREEVLREAEAERELRIQDVSPEDILVSKISNSVLNSESTEEALDEELFVFDPNNENSKNPITTEENSEKATIVKPKRVNRGDENA